MRHTTSMRPAFQRCTKTIRCTNTLKNALTRCASTSSALADLRVVDAAKADVRSRARPEPCVGWLATLAMLFLAFGAGMMVQMPPSYAVTH